MTVRYWTPEEDAVLRRLWAKGITSSLIARQLGRAPGATRKRAGLLGLHRRDEAERQSLAQHSRQYVRQKQSTQPTQTRSVAERIENIRGHFARLSARLEEWGRETDRLSQDMGFA